MGVDCVRGLLLFLVPLLLSPEPSAAASGRLVSDQASVMRSISRSLGSAAWNTSDPDPCRWAGILCTRAPASKVLHISLPGLGLSNNSLLRSFCTLGSLQSLSLPSNLFTSIPQDFVAACGGLPGIKLLNFSGNRLSGDLPAFSGFQTLEVLDLSYNLLNGSVESSSGLRRLPKLASLNVSFNHLGGAIPAGLSSAGTLRELSLSHNRFQGDILPAILAYRNLSVLDLSSNLLSGSDLRSIETLSRLEVLLLSSNNLTGEIPRNLSTMKNLRRFAANSNSFTGTIPPGITDNLQVLDLSFNKLHGGIPPGLLSPGNLESVDLSSNSLEGPLPVAAMSRRLFRLRLGGNRLNGSIPGPAIGAAGSLRYLELDGNALDGEIPPQLGRLANLTLLNLAGNRLEGVLPRELGNLSKLVVLRLQVNQIQGSIPEEFAGLGELLTLNLSRNSISGAIPSWVQNLTKLSVLNLDSNRLSGSIPSMIGNLELLMEIQLGNNMLSGRIPQMPRSLSTALNLSNNLFGGGIPSTLNLPQLEILDLSHNQLSGEVPTFFLLMKSLTHLVLSYNRLSGVLPALPSRAVVNIDGNIGLVNGTSAGAVTPPKRKSSVALIAGVSVAAALLVTGLAAAIFAFIIAPKHLYRVKDEDIPTAGDLPHVIEGSFLTEGMGHRSEVDFAKAMEDVSSPSNVLSKGRFSTYYKAAMPGGASYCVKKLNWSDKIFQMGNQRRFGEELEGLGKLSNSYVMAPLAFVLTADSAYLFYRQVPQGTLHDFLHNKRNGDGTLDWLCRYSIALGVAQGLTFLHGYNRPVLLLDLSTKSILLKSLREPQIGDIELFKVMDPSKSTGSISMLAGSAGYIPPEYAYTMRVTTAGNIYSFGVVLLELLTGKPPVNQGIELAKWALSLSYAARVREWDQILDPSIICGSSPAARSQMVSVLKVALGCVSQSAEARPKTRNVLRMLFNAR